MMSTGSGGSVSVAVARGDRPARRLGLTLMAVGPAEARLAPAAEVPRRLADAAAVGAADAGGDVPRPLLGVVGRHGDGAAVDDCGGEGVFASCSVQIKFCVLKADLCTGGSCRGPGAPSRSPPRSRRGSCSGKPPSGRGSAPHSDTGPGCTGPSGPAGGRRVKGQRRVLASRSLRPQPSGRHLAGGSGEAWQTFADEAVQQRVATPAVAARHASAVVPLELAVATHKARRTDALVPSGRVLKQENWKLI